MIKLVLKRHLEIISSCKYNKSKPKSAILMFFGFYYPYKSFYKIRPHFYITITLCINSNCNICVEITLIMLTPGHILPRLNSTQLIVIYYFNNNDQKTFSMFLDRKSVAWQFFKYQKKMVNFACVKDFKDHSLKILPKDVKDFFHNGAGQQETVDWNSKAFSE